MKAPAVAKTLNELTEEVVVWIYINLLIAQSGNFNSANCDYWLIVC